MALIQTSRFRISSMSSNLINYTEHAKDQRSMRLIFILYVMYYIFVNKIIPLNNSILSNFSITAGLFSFVGSLIMIFAISKRIKIINYKKLKRKILFQTDIMYSIINVLSLATVYFLFGSYFFSILFFISSISSLIYYIYYKKLNRDKYN